MAFKSLDDFKKAAILSGIMEIETSDMQFLLDERGLNSLLFTEPFSKLCFTCSAVSEFLRRGNVIYIDLDTAFTSYVRNGIFTFTADGNDLLIYLPSANSFEEILADICSRINSDVELVVMDSINSFYHLYNGIKIGSLNHLLISYISLLLNHASKSGSRLLVTSMRRHRKTTEWVLVPASKRLIESKSKVILTADLSDGNLLVNLVKHGTLKSDSKKFLLAQKQIPIAI